MFTRMRRLTDLLLVLASVAVLGCEHGTPSEPEVVEAPAANGEPQDLLGLPIFGGGKRNAGTEYTLIRDRLDLGNLIGDLVSLEVSRLIGVEGGELHLAGHTLRVPRGAVESPVVFTLSLLPTGYVEVDLTAAKLLGFLGRTLGISEFKKPITLEMTYARSPNVPEDPNRLLIVYAPGLLGYRNLEPVPSEVDTQRKVVRATLTHFSRYCMASN